jgi:hypothetical protein
MTASKAWTFGHIDLKTAFLQGEEYTAVRDVVCQLPPEAGHPPYIGARLKKPGYGLNDAPRKWWSRLDSALRSYGLQPARADRCLYIAYREGGETRFSKSRPEQSVKSKPEQSVNGKSDISDKIEDFMEYMLDPVTGSPSYNREVIGIMLLHVDDLFLTGEKSFWDKLVSKIRSDFQVGSEDKGDVEFTGQRIRWHNNALKVDQAKAIESLTEVKLDDKNLPDNTPCTPQLHTEFRSVLGSLNWLQSRTQYASAYKFSRSASASAAPTLGDCRALNKIVRTIRANPQVLYFWPLKGKTRLIGYPDASYRNNEDSSSQRGQCVFLAEARKNAKVSGESRMSGESSSRGSMVDYESTKIRRTTLSTTVAELYSFMKCYGTCLFLKGLWVDVSGEDAEVHMRTDAHKLITTASTTHLPEQKETIHMIQMLRKESNSGKIADLAHVSTHDCLSDCLTKHSAKPDNLIKAVETGILPNVDMHPPFRTLLEHKAYLQEWIDTNIYTSEVVFAMLDEPVPNLCHDR